MKNMFTGLKSIVLGNRSEFPAAVPDEELLAGALDGEIDRVKMALCDGAKIDACDEYARTALMEAATHGYYDIALLLIANGADVNWVDGCYRTPITSAVSHGHLNLAELLLKHGAKLDTVDEKGKNLLMLACVEGDAATTDFLLNTKEFAPDYRDRDGMTALMHAAGGGNIHIVRQLLSNGSDVNAVDFYGQTALMCAAHGNVIDREGDEDLDIVKLLLENGADPNMKDKSGKSALDYAREGDAVMGASFVNESIVAFLNGD